MKILVFAPNWVGDVIFTTPVFAAIKRQFPGAFVGCCLPARCKDVLINNPSIDEIVEFNERKEDKSFLRKIAFILSLRQKKYNVVIFLHRSLTRALLCRLAGVKELWGYAYARRLWLMTRQVPLVDKNSLHKQDYYLGVLRGLDIPVSSNDCEVFIGSEDKARVEAFLTGYGRAKRSIALNLLTNWSPKNWPLDYFKEFIDILKKSVPGVLFFLTSAASHKEFKMLLDGNKDYVIDLTGQTSLRRLAALYQKMDLVVSGDSGPLHLAAAVGTKYLGLYGPTDPRLTGVRARAKGEIIFKNSSCAVPCCVNHCVENLRCMKDITPQEAAQAVSRLLV